MVSERDCADAYVATCTGLTCGGILYLYYNYQEKYIYVYGTLAIVLSIIFSWIMSLLVVVNYNQVCMSYYVFCCIINSYLSSITWGDLDILISIMYALIRQCNPLQTRL